MGITTWFKALSTGSKILLSSGIITLGLIGIGSAAEPVIEVKTEKEIISIPFGTQEQKDHSLNRDESKVIREGAEGAKEITYEVTYSNGKITSKKVLTENVTKEAVDKIVAKGTLWTERIIKNETVGFSFKTEYDPTMEKGTSYTKQEGANGIKELIYEILYDEDKEKGRKLISEKITKAPVSKVVVYGTKEKSSCDPNYSGACVPIAYDVDCAGGSGNGPAYVRGPVYVIGHDIYDLDRDGDGVGCQ